jgi:hypothetical protein
MAVVGSRPINREYACTFCALATKVHLVDRRYFLLLFPDAEVPAELAESMQNNACWSVRSLCVGRQFYLASVMPINEKKVTEGKNQRHWPPNKCYGQAVAGGSGVIGGQGEFW